MTSYLRCCLDIPQRWVMCALCSAAIGIVSYKNRCIFEIVSLTRLAHVEHYSDQYYFNGCPAMFYFCPLENTKKALPFPVPAIFWNSKVMAFADVIFTLAKILFNIPSGFLADAGRARVVLALGILLSSLTSFLMPLATGEGAPWFLMVSFVDGVAESAIYPCSISLAGRWAPVSERNLYVAFVVVGWYVGDVVGLLVFHLMCAVSHWQATVISAGALGIIWFVPWYLFGFDWPMDSPLVTYEEYCIISPLSRNMTAPRLFLAPWIKIFTSAPFLSLILIFCAHKWLILAALSWVNYEYQMDILRLSGQLSSMASVSTVAAIPATLIGGFMSDWLVTRGVLTRTHIKRTFCALGVVLPSSMLIFIPLLGCSWAAVAAVYVAVRYFHGFANAVLCSNPVDLSPRYAGILMAIMISAGLIFSLFTTRLHDLFVGDVYSIDSWRVFFVKVFVFTCAMSLPFFIFGSGDQQRWNRLMKRRRNPPRNVTVPMNILEEPHRISKKLSKRLSKEKEENKKRVQWASNID